MKNHDSSMFSFCITERSDLHKKYSIDPQLSNSKLAVCLTVSSQFFKRNSKSVWANSIKQSKNSAYSERQPIGYRSGEEGLFDSIKTQDLTVILKQQRNARIDIRRLKLRTIVQSIPEHIKKTWMKWFQI